MTDLTPVERGALIGLMAAGAPLRESADICKRMGLSFTSGHRLKLVRLGLIRTISKKPLTHELTTKGWSWAGEELKRPRPMGTMGLGPLYALLNGLHHVLERRGLTLQGLFASSPTSSPSPTSGSGLTAEKEYSGLVKDAAWSEADAALALSLQDIATIEASFDRFDGSSEERLNQSLRRLRLAADLVLQNVKLAASRRGMRALTSRGEKVSFDPTHYETDDPIERGELAKVLKSPVVRGESSAQTVIARGLVEHSP